VEREEGMGEQTPRDERTCLLPALEEPTCWIDLLDGLQGPSPGPAKSMQPLEQVP
jgi:hypothetical protein